MSGLLALVAQDFRRLIANALFWVISATLIIIIVFINFALPRNVSKESYDILTYRTNQYAGFPAAGSEEELRQAVKERGAVGLLGSADGSITVLHPGLSEKTIRAIMVRLNDSSAHDISIVTINEDIQAIPYHKRMTPIFLCFEALIIGFILGGALMLSEKEEGTIRALRISPMGVDRYLLSKTALFSVIAVLYALLIAIFCIGVDFSIVRFVLLSFFGAAIFTLIGLAFTSLFRDMSSWFFSMALLLSLNMLPAVAYSEPSFAPFWIRVIPSYSILFSYEKILFGVDGAYDSVGIAVAGWCIGAYLLSRFLVGRSLLAKRRG